jgi:coenzyme F420 hydrogenase subunit beta
MGLDGVVHTGASPSRPWKNVTAISRTRQDVLWRSGSRYSPASPCELLTATTAHAPSVFVGKPCDVAALRAAQQLRPDLVRRFSCALSIFCAGTPSSAGTCQLLDLLGIEHDSVAELRYRGDGWPGELRVRRTGGQSLTPLMTYSQSWAFLQRFRPLRCHLCPDGVGVFADIACGDPWYRAIDPQEPGTSLVVVRTVRGQEILRGAHEAGYVTLRAAAWNILPASQPSLLRKRAALWGRLSALRMTGAPLPHYRDFGLFPLWKGLPLREKARSFTGTIARSVRRAYYLPRRMELPGGEHGSQRT